MSKIDIIRAWKDESYRLSLSEADRAELPASPAGPVELSDADLTGAGGEGADQKVRRGSVAAGCWVLLLLLLMAGRMRL